MVAHDCEVVSSSPVDMWCSNFFLHHDVASPSHQFAQLQMGTWNISGVQIQWPFLVMV